MPLDAEVLTDADLVAFAARKQWLLQARAPDRGGKQIPPDDPDWEILLWLAGRGFGKLLSVDEPIPTPAGWSRMGDLMPGDQVFDESGKVCRVTWTSPVQSPLETYLVKFSDGTVIPACADHQWVTWTHAERKAFLRSPYEDTTRFPDDWPAWRLRRSCGNPRRPPAAYPDSPGPQIRTTRQIAETLTYSERGDTNHCIPQCGALSLPEADLPIPPYVLGVWLGDGDTNGGAITNHLDDQPFLREQFAADGFETVPNPTRPTHVRVTGLTRLLKATGLLGNKHVPPAYLRASAPQRLALLRGLMDTDGGNDNSSLVSFTSALPALAEATAELAVSLGMKVRRDDRIPICTNNGVAGLRSYRVAFTPHCQVFTLPRKVARVNFSCGQALRRRHRMIEEVVRAEPMPMRCIQVDSPHRMYLAGRSMVPTHNSVSMYQHAWWEAWRVPNLIVHVVAPTLADVRGTSFEGPVGLCSITPAECMLGGTRERAYNKSTHELRLGNGSLIRGFGAQEEAGRLRGPQCGLLIGDELREWDKPAGNLELALSNALFGLRLRYPDGTPTRALLGTTPKAIPYLKRLEKRPAVRVVRGTSYENIRNLSTSFRSHLLSLAGTLMGRQEINGEYIDEADDTTIIKRSWVRLFPARNADGSPRKLPTFHFILQSLDTAQSEENYDAKRQETDPSGCIVLGVFNTHEALSDKERERLKVRGRYAALLLDCWTERLAEPDLLDKVRQQNRMKWGPTPGKRTDLALIEDKSSGPGVRQWLQRWNVPVWPYNPGRRSKTMRMHGIAPLVAQGCLFVPESDREDRKGLPRSWVEPFLEQVCLFAGPGSIEHDEMPDCLSQAMEYLRDRSLLEAKPEDEFLDHEEKLERDREEAQRLLREQERRKYVNPYAP